MGQSLVQNYLHIIFSTKHRAPLITEPFQNELYGYIAKICYELECSLVKIEGHYDHMHILCRLSKKMALMTLLQEIKSHSSKWMKTRSKELEHFYWQNGYGAFSVNPKQVDYVIAYIENQPKHHRKKTFKQEFRSFLEEHKVEYDERYVWA